MDFGQGNSGELVSGAPQGSESRSTAGQNTFSVQAPVKKGMGWKIFWGIVTGLSVLGNVLLFLMLVGVIVAVAARPRDGFIEEVIQKGRRINKIAVINLRGVIDDEQSKDVCRQIERARQDKYVKGLIIRVSSPGGTISGSDQIYNEIRKYREDTNEPAVAFMQGVAASGGYYTSVACEKIVAEPTVITGSVGVIMGYLVVQEFLEGKLGIQAVIIKSGQKKDWPSSFQPPTEEQLKYLEDKLIRPAYERFVKIVADGREELTLADVRRLSDGSIYGAQEALQEKLIDEIGYIDVAINLVSSLAGIEEPHVVEYRRPFSLASILSSRDQKNILRLDKAMLYELGRPEVLYLWNGY